MTDTEFTGRYMDGWVSGCFKIPLRHIKQPSTLTIYGRRYQYPEELTLSIYINGEKIQEAINPLGNFSIDVTVPPMIRGTLEIVASEVFVPQEKGINEDVRKLSFLLDEIKVPGLSDLMEPYVHLFDFKTSKKVYFLDDELWDQIAFLLADDYKVPDKKLLTPLMENEWWEKIQPPVSRFIRGTVYNKFSGESVKEGTVEIYGDGEKLMGAVPVNEQGYYEFPGIEAGDYLVVGKSDEYGQQSIKTRIDNYGKMIHLPMLPLF